jgi:phage terminase large subunit
MELILENNRLVQYRCPVCTVGTITIDKQSAHRYGYCDTCDAAYIHYVPLPHQLDVHLDTHKIKLLLGGMGSAKSNAGVMEIINHALAVPNGRTLMLAQTLQQLGEAIFPIFEQYLPRKFVIKWTNTKQEKKIVLNNGHELIGFASDDEEKFRSMDITAFYLEEASGISPRIYQECIRRLRNPHGVVDGVARYVGIVCSNPAQGFIRDLLFSSDVIKGSASIAKTVEMYDKRKKNINTDLAAFLSSSRDNPYLPDGFVQSVINSLTPQQVRLYVDCIIEYSEGAVYPEFLSYLCEPFQIPKNWERYMAHDPGIHDPAAILLSAINPDTGDIYFYRAFYKTDQVLAQIAAEWRKMTADIPQGMLRVPRIDPSANKRSKVTGKSYKQQLQIDYGIVTQDADNDIESGIQRVKNLMYHGKVHVFNDLADLIWEGCEYRYPTQEERNKNRNLGDTPLDKNNHLMDCLRYICQAIPFDYLEKRGIGRNEYLKFFDAMQSENAETRALSFKEMLDIINRDYQAQTADVNNKRYAGGYEI